MDNFPITWGKNNCQLAEAWLRPSVIETEIQGTDRGGKLENGESKD